MNTKQPIVYGKTELVGPQKTMELAEKLATYSDGEGYTPGQLLMACEYLIRCLRMNMQVKERFK